MEFVITFMIVMIAITILALLFASKKNVFENKNYFMKKQNFTANINHNGYLKNLNRNNQKNKSIFNIIGIGGVIIISLFFLSKLWTHNPIIGKWQSETNISFIGKSINEIEFTEDREYGVGITSKVKYEIEKNRVIVTDELGIGVIYEIIDNNTMRSNAFGMETIYRRIK